MKGFGVDRREAKGGHGLVPIKIHGGGLAGLSLAVGLLREGVSVQVFEAGVYPRHRVCGEFICGVKEEVLEGLGIAEVLASGERLSDCAWFYRDKVFLRRVLPVAGCGISRFELDLKLVEQVRALGGRVEENCRTLEHGGEREGEVWAVGRQRAGGKRWLGLKCHVSGYKMEADLEMHLGSGCYVGISRVEGGWLNICGLFAIRDGLGGGEGLLWRYLEACGLQRLALRLQQGEVRSGSESAVAGFRLGVKQAARDKCLTGRQAGVLDLGDAHMMIPPFTGNGMSMAFESAAEALPELVYYATGAARWDQAKARVGKRLNRRFRKRMMYSMALHPLILNDWSQKALSFFGHSRFFPYESLFYATR